MHRVNPTFLDILLDILLTTNANPLFLARCEKLTLEGKIVLGLTLTLTNDYTHRR